MKGFRELLFLLFVFLCPIPYTLYPVSAANSLDQINQKVCDRFENDTAKLAGIMEEVKNREGIKETRVAFGNVDTPIESADYKITYAAEAIAFERAQKFSSASQLRYSLEALRNKILNAKKAVGVVINEK